MKFHLFLFNSGESATVMDTPVLTVETYPAPTEITHDMLIDIVYGLQVGELPESSPIEKFMAMTDEQLIEYLAEHIGLQFDKCAVIVDENNLVDKITFAGEALGETMVGDSSCYMAAEVFGNMLLKYAHSVIDFPEYDGGSPNT